MQKKILWLCQKKMKSFLSVDQYNSPSKIKIIIKSHLKNKKRKNLMKKKRRKRKVNMKVKKKAALVGLKNQKIIIKKYKIY